MASTTCDSFLEDISSERGEIASLSEQLEFRWMKMWLGFKFFKLNYKLTVFLKDLDNWETDKNGAWQDQEYLNTVKNYLQDLIEDLRNLAENQIRHDIYTSFAQIELGLIERFEEKIEMLSISTDPEIKNLITAIGEKVSH